MTQHQQDMLRQVLAELTAKPDYMTPQMEGRAQTLALVLIAEALARLTAPAPPPPEGVTFWGGAPAVPCLAGMDGD